MFPSFFYLIKSLKLLKRLTWQFRLDKFPTLFNLLLLLVLHCLSDRRIVQVDVSSNRMRAAQNCTGLLLFLMDYPIHRGSYISAHVSLNLSNKSGRRDKMRGLPSILSLFRNEFHKFNNKSTNV